MYFVSPKSAQSTARRVTSWVATLAVSAALVAFVPSCKKDDVDANKAAADKTAADKEAAAKASANKASADKAAADKAAAAKAAADKTAKSSGDQAAVDKAAAEKAAAEKAAADKAAKNSTDTAAKDKAAAEKAAAEKAAADKAAADAHATKATPTAYDSWAKLKAGSSITLTTTSETKFAAQPKSSKTETETVTVLKEVTPDKVVIQTTTNVGGVAGTPNTSEIAKVAPAGTAAPVTPPANMKQSDETISVAGKDYKCHVVETTFDANGTKTTSKVWTSADVPNMMVKMESNSEGAAYSSKTKMEVTKIDLK